MSHKLKLLLTTVILSLSLGAYATTSDKGDYEEFKMKASQQLDKLEIKLEKLKDKTVKLSGDAKDKLVLEYKELKASTAKYREEVAKAGEQASETTAQKWDDFKEKMEEYGEQIESKLDKTIN